MFASPQVPGATSTPSCEQQSDHQCESDNNGGDVTNPTSGVELRLEDRAISRPTTRTRKRELELRLSTKVVLPSGWKLHLLGELPAELVTTSYIAPPKTIQNSGLSDIFFQAALFHPIDDRWAFGFGARLIAPSLSAGVGQTGWEIMPLAGVRAMLPELGGGSYFAPFARYAVGLAGRKVSDLQIAPTLNIQMQERWFVTFYPSNDIRINYGGSVAGETGRLFLPLDMAIGRLVSDNVVVTLEASAPIIKDYPVYDFKTELRVLAKF